ncbi:Dak1 domain-containing protein [Geopyxis carbonaria]|nr:Dak1 domain-containing protein [Geopyxis carbonaria]
MLQKLTLVIGKHFVNDPTVLVTTALKAVPYTNPSLELDNANKIIYRKSAPKQVAVVSGGGAGHEPSFVGLVGDGILRAAVSGTIFSSPSVKQIYNCVSKRVAPNSGVLLIVMNYTGDVLHFGLATEKAKAQALNVEMIVVGDDVGVGREKSGKVGRRGIAGTVLVHKITGALAATGASLDECAQLAKLVSSNLVSMGSSLAHVHVPGTGMGESEVGLKFEEIELGMGIHNEQGSTRMGIPELPTLIDMMLKQLLDKNDSDRNYLDPKENSQGWVLMINNLGGVSPLELGGVTAEVLKQLDRQWEINPKRVYSGTFMTSLNGNGFSMSLLRTVETGLGMTMIDLLDAPHETTGWNSAIRAETWDGKNAKESSPESDDEDILQPSELKMDINKFSKTLSAGLEKLIEAEAMITKYDSIVGDGDCGIGLRRGAEAVIDFISKGGVTDDTISTIIRLADVVEENMDGTSGALYSIFLNALVKALRDAREKEATFSTWTTAALTAMAGLGRYTPAQPGDRTLVDALHPWLVTLAETKDLKMAAQAAREGAESTKGMRPKLGRTVYVGDIGKVPDPGAIGIAVFAEGLAGL